MNYHADLGVSNIATEKEITDAYRRLAMKHHPDRGGDQETFKRISVAYAHLQETGFAPYRQPQPQQQQQHRPYSSPEAPSGTWRDRNGTIDSIYEQMKKSRPPPPKGFNNYIRPDDEIVARVTMREAFAGFNMQVPRHKPNGFVEYVHVNVPPGTPDGYRGTYKLSDGSYQTITTSIEKSSFTLRGFGATDSIFNAGLNIGDIEVEVEADAIDLITGNWIHVKDFLGENLSVRIPAGFNPRQRLKVANKGYAGWSEEYAEATKFRRDMYIKILPIFNKPEDIDPKKILNLYNMAEGLSAENQPDAD